MLRRCNVVTGLKQGTPADQNRSANESTGPKRRIGRTGGTPFTIHLSIQAADHWLRVSRVICCSRVTTRRRVCAICRANCDNSCRICWRRACNRANAPSASDALMSTSRNRFFEPSPSSAGEYDESRTTPHTCGHAPSSAADTTQKSPNPHIQHRFPARSAERLLKPGGAIHYVE
jgi:hypothetical protein